ncbi:MAG: zinc dependent phospholipase C family protein [Burkholderiaceae bacterium]|jgi:hypothetical protein|nr:zinc dependent phospholipase C family protein [Burkholderiaceae bacterium]
MPGAYAHLSVVGSLSASNPLGKAPGFTSAAKAALLRNTCFCDLGAVSPDYPYLDILHSSASAWADLMHYDKTGQMIKTGVEIVRGLKSNEQSKAFAWLLGYTSHVITDVTIHPIVELKVGPYAENKMRHRECEMNQDAHIFPKELNVGPVGLSEYLDSGIRQCSVPGKRHKLDPVISGIWREMLKTCYPSQFQKNVPDIDGWHKAFIETVDLAEESARLFPFARHAGVGLGLTYPLEDEIDPQYINALQTPHGPMSYDAIFARAKRNVLDTWSLIAAGVFKGDEAYKARITDWNLDTGKDMNGELAFWRDAA